MEQDAKAESVQRGALALAGIYAALVSFTAWASTFAALHWARDYEGASREYTERQTEVLGSVEHGLFWVSVVWYLLGCLFFGAGLLRQTGLAKLIGTWVLALVVIVGLVGLWV